MRAGWHAMVNAMTARQEGFFLKKRTKKLLRLASAQAK
jgi:hypothetical protein